MSTLSTHALDTASGRPAAGLRLVLEQQPQPETWQAFATEYFGQAVTEPGWILLARGVTNADGRCPDLLPAGTQLTPGIYRVSFDTAGYFAARDLRGFYPLAQITFEILATDEHYHVPLLLSPFGFSTYRGS
jgi:5-hydroxyisourate hydrolase